MGAMAEMTEGLAGGLGVITSPVAAQARFVALAERFLQRQLELVDGVIEEVTLKNALFRMGIDWRWAAEVLGRRDFARMYEQTPRGVVRLVGWWEAVRARMRGPERRPLRVSQPYEPGRKRRRPSVWSMTPLKRVFLAILELARNWPIFGPEERPAFGPGARGWAESLCLPIRSRKPKISAGAPPWQQRMQQEAFSVGLIHEYNDALEELWGYDPVLARWLEDMACRPLRYGNPTAWLRGAWVE
jgi:hypothetical protein